MNVCMRDGLNEQPFRDTSKLLSIFPGILITTNILDYVSLLLPNFCLSTLFLLSVSSYLHSPVPPLCWP